MAEPADPPKVSVADVRRPSRMPGASPAELGPDTRRNLLCVRCLDLVDASTAEVLLWPLTRPPDRSAPELDRAAPSVNTQGGGAGVAPRDRPDPRDGPDPSRNARLPEIVDSAGVDTPLAMIAAGDLAMTKSSVAVQRLMVAGRPVHHLIDPATDQPGGDGLLAVTVAGPDTRPGPRFGRDPVPRRACPSSGRGPRARGLAASRIGDDRSLEMTPAARIRIAWIAAEA